MRHILCMCVCPSGVESSSANASMSVDFDAVFGTKAANNDAKPAAGKINKTHQTQ